VNASSTRPKVILREIQDADLPILFEHQADPESTRMAAFPARDRETFDAHWLKIRRDPDVVLRAILADGAVAGNIVCFGPPEERQVGYWIGREYWGRGIASLALAAFLDVVPSRPLYAHVAVHNAASIRVLEKSGFRKIREGHVDEKNGNAFDEVVLELGSPVSG